MGPWEHCILQCIPTCHGILEIPNSEMCTCHRTLGTQDPEPTIFGILGTLGCRTLGTLGCRTLGTLDPEMHTCHGTLGTQDPEMYT